MTREEKSNLLNELLEIEEKNDIGNLTRAERREFQQWVEDLEQEPVLDKIKAEVTALKSHNINDSHDDGFQGCRIEVLGILDKYKAESESEE